MHRYRERDGEEDGKPGVKTCKRDMDRIKWNI